jgi:hypothetical protein
VPDPVLRVHPTGYTHNGDASPQSPGGMAAIYRNLVADDDRLQQVVQDVHEPRERGRHCLVLTQWTSHLERLTSELEGRGHAPVVLRGGMGARQRAAALADGGCSTSPPNCWRSISSTVVPIRQAPSTSSCAGLLGRTWTRPLEGGQ